MFVYGTLAPGEVNEHVLAPLRGNWQPASLRGYLHAEGWGASHGFPALELDATAEFVAGQLFRSTELPGFWQELDDFEGADYTRVTTSVALASGETVLANVYVINRE